MGGVGPWDRVSHSLVLWWPMWICSGSLAGGLPVGEMLWEERLENHNFRGVRWRWRPCLPMGRARQMMA